MRLLFFMLFRRGRSRRIPPRGMPCSYGGSLMSKKVDVGNLGRAATGNGRLKLFKPPGTAASIQVLTDRDRHRLPDTRPPCEGTTPKLAEEKCPSLNREG